MTERLIVGNLKMQWKGQDDMEAYVRGIETAWPGVLSGVRLVVCPSFPFLGRLRAGLPDDIAIGAQDVSREMVGAYTGEVSASMLASLGTEYVIVGHSERRRYQGEGDALIGAKAKAALAAGLTVVWCVGETQEERTAGRTIEVLQEQLQWVTEAGVSDGTKLCIAYEPRWAIGTDHVPTTEEILGAVEAIRLCVAVHLPASAESVRVLYGGSVKESNVESVSVVSGADGVLVGRESLLPEILMVLYRKLSV